MIVIGIIIAILLVYILITYNKLIKARNKVKQAESGIDVYLTQRFDLIPNLIECVKEYTEYEGDLFNKVTEMRARYMQNKDLKLGEELNNDCNKLLAVAEDYPVLKASEQFLNLQKNLSKMESQLQAARRIYNMEVNEFNNKVQMFPSNLIAGLFGFEQEQFFQAEEQARKNVEVNMRRNR